MSLRDPNAYQVAEQGVDILPERLATSHKPASRSYFDKLSLIHER